MKYAVGVVVLALCLVATAAFATEVFPPPGGVATTVEEWNDILGMWVQLPASDHRAECWHMGSPVMYFCNGSYINERTGEFEAGPYKFDVEASVAQYLEFRLSKNGLAWYIAKPHLYVADTGEEKDRYWKADSISINVKSNGDIRLDFVSFGDLIGVEHPDKTIPSKWWLETAGAQPPPDSDDWQTGDFSLEIDENMEHPVLEYKLWNMLKTGKCTSACEYEDTGAIFVVLEEQKDWVAHPLKYNLPTIPRPDP